MPAHESPGLTVYSSGGRGVQVGAWVGVSVTVGVMVMVGLDVAVPDSGVISAVSTGVFDWSTRNTTTAPNVINRANRPKAAGRDNVISGSRLALTFESFFGEATLSSSVPQTKQRFADSFNLVPQTGQSFVFEVFVSGLIIIGRSIPQAFDFMQYAALVSD